MTSTEAHGELVKPPSTPAPRCSAAPFSGLVRGLDVTIGRTASNCHGILINARARPATRSMRSAIDDLGLSRLDVIHPGDRSFPLAGRVRAVAGTRIVEDI